MSRPPSQQQQPQFTIAKPGGVVPTSAANAQANVQANGGPQKSTARAAPQKLKTLIRRLPPGLTQQEFEAALGEEWNAGQGRISWTQYRPGKVSKDLSKPSRPARAYLQLVQQTYLDQLAEIVRETSFVDARKTDNDPVLLGPPVLEFAPYGRVAFGRKRHDARQGLIDQDPDFIQFLESLTNPISKPIQSEDASDQLKDDTKQVTPLIKHLREKKAAKEAAKKMAEDKEKASQAKAGKHNRGGSKIDKEDSILATSQPTQKAVTATALADKKGTRPGKAERVAKTSSKQAKKENQAAEAKAQVPAPAATQIPKAAAASPAKRPEGAGPGSAAARIIQRDLGIRGGRGVSTRRGGRQGPVDRPVNAANAPANGATVQPSVPPQALPQLECTAAPQSSVVSAKPTPKQTPVVDTTTHQGGNSSTVAAPSAPAAKAPPTGPGPKAVNKPAPTGAASRPAKALSNPTSTQAFLKHANPSQGITVPLLEEAFKVFGEVNKVDIDMRKGFAYVDFREPESLQKAMAASPIKVAQGTVQVLERKDRSSAQPAGPAAPPTGPARGGPAMMVPRGGQANFGIGFRGARAMRGGRGGSMRGAPGQNAVGAVNAPAAASGVADGPADASASATPSSTSETVATPTAVQTSDNASNTPAVFGASLTPAADAAPTTTSSTDAPT